jgi:HK97 family phage portal protein
MGFFSVFKKKQQAQRKKNAIIDHRSFDNNNNISLNGTKGELNAYQFATWADIAIDRICDSIEQQPYHFENKEGVLLDDRRIPDEILIPIRNGWQDVSFNEMLSMITNHVKFTGNAFLMRSTATPWGQDKGIFDSLIPLMPDQVKLKTTPDKLFISHYEVTINGMVFHLDKQEIIHFRQNTVLNPFWGVGNISKARIIAEASIAAEQYSLDLFSKQGKEKLLITEDSQLTPQDYSRRADLMRSKFANNEDVLLLSGQDINTTKLGLSPNDMQFVENAKMNIQTFLSLFGVHPFIAGIPEGTNRSSSDNVYRIFYQNTINPMLKKLENTINKQFVSKIDPNVVFRLQKYNVGNIDDVIKSVNNMIITPNRAAEILGEETDYTDEARNTYYSSSSLIPLSIESEDTPEDDQEDNQEEPKKKDDLRDYKSIIDTFESKALPQKKFQVRFLRAALKSRLIVEDKYLPGIVSYFDDQKKRILDNLNSIATKSIKIPVQDIGVEMLFDVNQESDIMRNQLKPLHTSAVQRAVANINDLTSSRVNLNTSNPFIASAISRLGQRITGTLDHNGDYIATNKTTKDAIAKLIEKSVNENWSVNELQDAIQDKFEQFGAYRARMIARTESRAAYDAGSQVAYQEIGVKTVDVVGCTQFESDSDCGKTDIPVIQISSLSFHPNHIGVVLPSKEEW